MPSVGVVMLVGGITMLAVDVVVCRSREKACRRQGHRAARSSGPAIAFHF